MPSSRPLPPPISLAALAALVWLGAASVGCSRASEASPSLDAATTTGESRSPDAARSDAAAEAKAPPDCPAVSRDEAWLAIDADAPELPTIDDPAKNLARFYRRWAEVARGRSKRALRIAVYGDSNLTLDGLTGLLRRAFQQRYGDAGHGFVALGKPWGWYRHHDVVHASYENMWKFYATTTAPAPDNQMGFSGIAVEAVSPGAQTWVGTAAEPDAPIGKTASRFGVYFLKRPGGGPFDVRVDGKSVKEVSTRASETELGYDELTVEDAPHKVTYVAKGTVRLLGATLGRDVPNSVTVDSLGVGSLNAWALARLDTKVNRAMLAHRDFDLVMFLVGTNMYALEKHHEWMGRVVRHHRLATPGVPLLFFSPPDITLGNKGQKTDPRIHKVAEQLHDIAREHGAAFWDFHAAMGGDRSIVAFRQKKWAQADIIHFTDEGSFFMGRRVLLALWRGLLESLDRDPQLGCDAARP
ncbi:MAG TPA: GDSL-type esterase/lipase family protein [Polyangiaceae bacterium]|nr:GDSL-type esterase/lipase family protein [Polyangiaceae bacterium]